MEIDKILCHRDLVLYNTELILLCNINIIMEFDFLLIRKILLLKIPLIVCCFSANFLFSRSLTVWGSTHCPSICTASRYI